MLCESRSTSTAKLSLLLTALATVSFKSLVLEKLSVISMVKEKTSHVLHGLSSPLLKMNPLYLGVKLKKGQSCGLFFSAAVRTFGMSL